MKNIKFSYFSADAHKSECLGLVSLDYFINAIKKPTTYVDFILDAVQEAQAQNNPEAKAVFKKKLFSFTPAVMFEKGQKRRYANISSFTGLMQLDFDKIPTREEAIELKEYLFYNNPQIVCAFLSPSGLGVKCLLRTLIPKNIESYKLLYNAVEREFEQYSYFDTSVKNAVLPMFISRDKDILFRNSCAVWSETYDKPINHAPPVDYTPKEHTDRQAKYFYDKTVRIFSDKINSINDNGHPQVRDACLILGHRVAAGYITLNEAEGLAHNLITSNSYLKKGTRGYLKTAMDRIKIGLEYPLEY